MVFGLVLPDNTKMLKLCEQLGFHVGDYASGRGIKRVSLSFADRNRP